MIKENKLGTMPVGKLLITMSIPTMFSMLIQALYNVVDSIFVSRVSELALTAVSLAFPMQNLMIAFAVGTAVGVSSLISRRLGEKREEEATTAATTGLVIELIAYLIFAILGIFFTKAFFKIFTYDVQLIEMGTEYLSICLIMSFGCFMACVTEKILQGTGDTVRPMIIQLTGAIFNIIFDPILIFGYFGLPAMGIKGAALATVFGQITSMVLSFIFLQKNRYLKVKLTKLTWKTSTASDIMKVGLPSIVMQSIGTIMTSAMNAILISFSATATTVFGVYFKLQSFVFMPVFGLNSGLMPILGYNFGAKNKKRMFQALKDALFIAMGIMFVGFLLFQLIPDKLLALFNASENMSAIGIVALRAISWSFLLAGICISLGAVFQAVGDGYYSMLVSLGRQLVVLVPSAWILGKVGGLNAVWYSFIIAELISLSMTLFFFRKELKKINVIMDK